MKVRIKRSQLTYFRSQARKTRNEIYGMLIGQRFKHSIRVAYIAYPALDVSNPNECKPNSESYLDIEQFARGQGLVVLGTVHSHPGAPAYMSPTDLQSHIDERSVVSGIVEIVGRNRRTRVTFWRHNTPVPCRLEYL